MGGRDGGGIESVVGICGVALLNGIFILWSLALALWCQQAREPEAI